VDNRTLYREHQKFEEDARDGETNVRVTGGIVTESQLAALSDDDIALPAMSPHGEVYLASHDYTTQSERVGEIDPIPEKYEYSTIDTQTSAADATTFTYYIPMAGYTRLDLQFVVTAGVIIIEHSGSMQADGTAPASLAYFDLDSEIYDSFISVLYDYDDGMLLLDSNKNAGAFNYVKLVVTTAAISTFAIYAKKWWQ
jgi:hypothetical protein